MIEINIDCWVSGCKVRAFPWVDGENYYVNVQGFQPGGAVSRPAWEKTVYVTGTNDGYIMLRDYLHTLVDGICRMDVPVEGKCVLDFELSDIQRKMAAVDGWEIDGLIADAANRSNEQEVGSGTYEKEMV